MNQWQSNQINYIIAAGDNDLGMIQACGVTTQEFCNYSINGINYSLSSPADSFYTSNNGTPTSINIAAFALTGNRWIQITSDYANVTVGGTETLYDFQAAELPDSASIFTPINVHITEFGAVGEYMSGNFSGTMLNFFNQSIAYTITCSFRIRRSF